MFWQRTKPKPRIGYGALSDVGRVRAENQDAFGHFTGDRDGAPREHLFIIADGMGGHARGREASTTAVDVVQRVFFENREGTVRQRLENAFTAANDAIHRLALEKQPYEMMGTTCTALAFADGFVHVAHVGDTRAYRIRRTTLEQLTTDHTVAEELLREGVLTEREAMSHPQRHALMRALGVAQHVKLDVSDPMPAEKGDYYLLCSDGLAPVSREALVSVVRSLEPQKAAERLVQMAIEEGSEDNVTVMVIRVRS